MVADFPAGSWCQSVVCSLLLCTYDIIILVLGPRLLQYLQAVPTGNIDHNGLWLNCKGSRSFPGPQRYNSQQMILLAIVHKLTAVLLPPRSCIICVCVLVRVVAVNQITDWRIMNKFFVLARLCNLVHIHVIWVCFLDLLTLLQGDREFYMVFSWIWRKQTYALLLKRLMSQFSSMTVTLSLI